MGKGARSGQGGGKGRRKAKNQEMAAMLRGVSRESGRCPVCYRIVKNGTHPNPALCN